MLGFTRVTRCKASLTSGYGHTHWLSMLNDYGPAKLRWTEDGDAMTFINGSWSPWTSISECG